MMSREEFVEGGYYQRDGSYIFTYEKYVRIKVERAAKECRLIQCAKENVSHWLKVLGVGGVK